MIKYIEQVPAWGLQISALKNMYNDRNITLHFLREFGNTDALIKEGATTTSPLFYILQNGKVEKLRQFLTARYPNHQETTEEVMRQVKEAQGKQVEQPQEDEPVVVQPTDTTTPDAAGETTLLLQTILQEIQQRNPAADKQTEIPNSLARLREKRRKAYRQDKTFEEEYDWIPTLFNALYFLTSPIVAGFGALFFYNQIHAAWLFAAVAVVFLLLELVFRRTIVRRCIAALMRGRYIFGAITMLIAFALSAWSILALWNGTARIQSMQGIFQPSPATGQITVLTDSIANWRAEQKNLEGKWGVSLHRSKDLSRRIEDGERQLTTLSQQVIQENQTGTAIWRYIFLLLEAIVLLSLALPVWYEVRCVQEQE